MEATSTTKTRGSKIDFFVVLRLLDEAKVLNTQEPGSGRHKMVEAKAEFDKFTFDGLRAAHSVARTFEMWGL